MCAFHRHSLKNLDGDFMKKKRKQGKKKPCCESAALLRETLMPLPAFPGTFGLGVLEIEVQELENTNFIYSGATGKRECVSMEMG